MIALGRIKIDASCPLCGRQLTASGWRMPGMRALAKANCVGCSRDYFVDLPMGQALYSPMILSVADGEVHDPHGVTWFAEWLRQSWRDRVEGPAALTVERHRDVRRPVILLNCIDRVYGHALLKLFNAQPYLDKDRFDLIVLAQRQLAGLIPDGVAESWLIDLPFAEGARWNDGLADAIAKECERFDNVHLAPAHSHPHPSSFAIERFSKVAPFALSDWKATPPTITFIWRDDRIWVPGGLRRPSGWNVKRQGKAVVRFFEALRSKLPGLDAAVAGLAEPGGLSGWINDMRTTNPDPDTEMAWIRRYATSHLAVGVQGSSMILPTAHAGAALEILDDSRSGNFLQDVLFNGHDVRDLMFRYRFFPPDTQPKALAAVADQIVARYPDFRALMPPQGDHVRD